MPKRSMIFSKVPFAAQMLVNVPAWNFSVVQLQFNHVNLDLKIVVQFPEVFTDYWELHQTSLKFSRFYSIIFYILSKILRSTYHAEKSTGSSNNFYHNKHDLLNTRKYHKMLYYVVFWTSTRFFHICISYFYLIFVTFFDIQNNHYPSGYLFYVLAYLCCNKATFCETSR